MGSNQCKPVEVEVLRKPQNRLSKPRTNTSTLNLLGTNVPSAASRRNSLSIVPLAASDKRSSFVAPENPVADTHAISRRNSISTRQRLRDTLFRSKSSDGRSRGTSIVTREGLARDAAVDRWYHSAISNERREDSQFKFEEIESSRQSSSRPTSRRGSTAYTPYSHHASRLSLVVEAHTPEPNIREASRRLEELSERTNTDLSNSDTSTIPIRRRSMLMTPGVATRRDSNGELLYEAFPVSRRLSAVGTLGSRNSWFDPSTPGPSSFVELPAPVPPAYTTSYGEDCPRTVTPSEQAFSLGAYKHGSLRIINADHLDDADCISIRIPQRALRLETTDGIGQSRSKSPKSAQEYQQDPDSLSPFSFENSRSPSPQLQTTSKNTAVEDELFEDEITAEIVIGSPEHALSILDGSATTSPIKPVFDRSQTAPVRVLNSYGSLNNAIQVTKEIPYKPLTKNDSGYSSNVSLRSFKAQAEARAAAAKSTAEIETSEQGFRRKHEALRTSNGLEVLHTPGSDSVNLATSNAPSQLPEKSVVQKMAAVPTTSPSAEYQKPWSFRPSLTISRKPSNSSPIDQAQTPNSASSKSPISMMRRLTKTRAMSQPIIVTSNRAVDSKLIPPVSPRASAKLEERQKACPTLSHTYKSISRTNSMETLTTILSASDTIDLPVDKRIAISPGRQAPSAPFQRGSMNRAQFELGDRPSSTPAEMKTSKPLQRPASSNQVQTDFEVHITSFGTVCESLGASPYDLAVSTMTPRQRSKSFRHLSTDFLGNPTPNPTPSPNRSTSSNDLAPHHTRTPLPTIRTGMSADTASRLARQKSRDREIGRRMSAEKLRDDRTALPSNRLSVRTGSGASDSPVRSSHAQKRLSRTPPPPPVTMSPYRKSLLAQELVLTGAGSVVAMGVGQGAAVGSKSNVTYPQNGPWVPQRPRAMQWQSADDAVHVHPGSDLRIPNHSVPRRPLSNRPSLENIRQSPAPQRNHSYGNVSNSYTPDSSNHPMYSRSQPATQVLDRYSNGLGYSYEATYGNSMVPSRNKWIGHGQGNVRNADNTDSALGYGVDFSDVPVLVQTRARQEV